MEIKANQYKTSEFNIAQLMEDGQYLLMNTLTTAVVKVKESSFMPVYSKLLQKGIPFDLSLDAESKRLLISNGFIVDADFDEIKWLEDLHWKSRFGEQALGIGVALTLDCNFRCTYCYQKHTKIDIPEEYQNSIIKFAAKNLSNKKFLRMMWFGGEPLLMLKTIENMSHRLIELANSNNVIYDAAITTNGFLLNKTTCKALVNVGVTDVQVTIDGPPSIHDQRRIMEGGFPTFQTIMNNLYENSEMFSRMIVRINIDKRNADHIEELFEILLPIRDHIELAFRPATSPVSPLNDEPWCLPPKSYWTLEETLASKAFQLGFKLIKGYAFPGSSFCSGYQQNSPTIDPYGDVHKCPICIGRRNQRYGTINFNGDIKVEQGFQKDWESWSPFQDKNCTQCEALPLCMGGCLWHVGQDKNSYRCFALQNLTKFLEGETLL